MAGHKGGHEGTIRANMDVGVETNTAGGQQQVYSILKTTYLVLSFAFKPLFHPTDYLLHEKPQSFNFLIV